MQEQLQEEQPIVVQAIRQKSAVALPHQAVVTQEEKCTDGKYVPVQLVVVPGEVGQR